MRSIIRLPILTHSLRLCQRIWPAQGVDNLALALKNLQPQAYNGTKNVIISVFFSFGDEKNRQGQGNGAQAERPKRTGPDSPAEACHAM